MSDSTETTTETIKNINLHYDNFLKKGKDTLMELFEAADLTGEEKAKVIASMISSSQTNSLNAIKDEKQIEKDEILIATEKMKQKRQYGAVFKDGDITYSNDGNSVIEKQIDGFDKSNLKSLATSFQQAVGMIYNSGESVPAWYMDTIKTLTEELSNKKVDFQKDSDTGDTELTDDTSWEQV